MAKQDTTKRGGAAQKKKKKASTPRDLDVAYRYINRKDDALESVRQFRRARAA